jgi:hypothetical protein
MKKFISNWWAEITAQDSAAVLLWGGFSLWALYRDHKPIWALGFAFMSGRAFRGWWGKRGGQK